MQIKLSDEVLAQAGHRAIRAYDDGSMHTIVGTEDAGAATDWQEQCSYLPDGSLPTDGCQDAEPSNLPLALRNALLIEGAIGLAIVLLMVYGHRLALWIDTVLQKGIMQ